MERKAVLIFLPGQIHPSQYSSIHCILLLDSCLSQDLVIKYHDFQQQIVNVIPELNPLPCECVVLPMIGINSDIYDKKVKGHTYSLSVMVYGSDSCSVSISISRSSESGDI